MSQQLTFGTRRIGPDSPCFIIAEAGVNHNGDMEMARKLIDVAANAGADAVKFQTFKAEKLVSAHGRKALYQLASTSNEESQREMLRKLELPRQEHLGLMRLCAERGIMFLSSPFEEESATFLAELGVSGLKLPSGEITNYPFLEHVGRLKLPVILSTGMSTLADVDEGLSALRGAGCPAVALLHCVSNYPADPAACNLRAMDTLTTAFQVPVGFSDHAIGMEVSLAAVARGACLVEKHITLDKSLPGPDQRASMAPEEFKAFVRAIRVVESALGDGRKVPVASERDTAEVARKSIVANVDIPAGVRIERSMLAMRRPGTGMPAKLISLVAGRMARTAISEGTTLEWSHVQ